MKRRETIVGLLVGTVVAIVLSLAMSGGMLSRQRAALADMFFQNWTGGDFRASAERVVIVAVDDASLGQLGRVGQWPRRYYAQLIDRLSDGQARGVAFDIGFIEPSDDDDLVIEAIRRFTSRERQSVARPVVIMPVVAVSPQPPVAPPTFGGLIQPRAGLTADSIRAHVSQATDQDGIVRRIPLVIRAERQELPALSLAAAAAFTNTAERGYQLEGETVAAMGRHIPTDQFGHLRVTFAGVPSHVGLSNPGLFRVVSFADVVSGRTDPAVFRDRMVFVGALDAVGLGDMHLVPTSGRGGPMAGVEIHASAFATLLSGRIFTDPGGWGTLVDVWLFALLTGAIVFRLGTIAATVVTVGLVLVYLLVAPAFTSSASMAGTSAPGGTPLPDLVYPPLAILLTLWLGTIGRTRALEAEIRKRTYNLSDRPPE